MSPEDEEIRERLARVETEMKWLVQSFKELKRDVNRARWELVGGLILLIALNVLMKVMGL